MAPNTATSTPAAAPANREAHAHPENETAVQTSALPLFCKDCAHARHLKERFPTCAAPQIADINLVTGPIQPYCHRARENENKCGRAARLFAAKIPVPADKQPASLIDLYLAGPGPSKIVFDQPAGITGDSAEPRTLAPVAPTSSAPLDRIAG